jgi:uncharacterized lipoprotein YddW (UPF0748 family)
LLLAGCPPAGADRGTFGDRGPEEREPEPPPPDPRAVWPPKAIWVVRRAYTAPEQIAELMERCRAAGFNTVLFQVRGHGTVYYRSRLEPWAEEYRSPPGFDPLAVACREAHRRGMALHAWVNVMPIWRGQRPPPWPEHVYNAHPEWLWYDQTGRRQPLGSFYVSVNPCLPEVREYLVGVFEEIVRHYPVDGLHLDYIRFPSDQSPKGADYPYDARTLDLYARATGKSPRQDRAAWSRWRTEQVTRLVRDIREMTRWARPGVRLTAACWADLDAARRDYFQDGAVWTRGGWVDLVFTMNYTRRNDVFRTRQEVWQRATAGRRVAAGIEATRTPGDPVVLEQVRQARLWGGGLAVFSDQLLFTDPQSAQTWAAALRPILTAPQAALRR